MTVSRPHAVALGIGLEARQVDDGEVRHEAGELGGRRPAQQVADEQRVPGVLDEDARVEPVRRVGAGVEVLHEQLARLGVRREVGPQQRRTARASSACCCPTRRPSRWSRRARCTCPAPSGRCARRSPPPARPKRQSAPRPGGWPLPSAPPRACCDAPSPERSGERIRSSLADRFLECHESAARPDAGTALGSLLPCEERQRRMLARNSTFPDRAPRTKRLALRSASVMQTRRQTYNCAIAASDIQVNAV